MSTENMSKPGEDDEVDTNDEPLLHQVPRMLQGILSDDASVQIKCAIMFRQLSGLVKPDALNESIPEIVKSGALHRFVEFLEKDDNPHLQYEAAWFLTNFISASGENTRKLIEMQALPIFIRLLTSRLDAIREQGLWILGNIAGESTFYRDLVIATGAVEPILQAVNPESKVELLRTAAFVLSNLIRGAPEPGIAIVRRVLPLISQLLHNDDEQVLTDSCRAIEFITHGGVDEYLQVVIDYGVCQHLFEKISHPSTDVQLAVVCVAGNIASGLDSQTQTIISCPNVLPSLRNLLSSSPSEIILSKICFAVSNMAGNTIAAVHAVLESNIYTQIIPLLSHQDAMVREEATWAVSNAIVRGAARDVYSLVQQGCVPPLCDLLVEENMDILGLCLSALERILHFGKLDAMQHGTRNRMALLIDQAGGLPKIERLMFSDTAAAAASCLRILGIYFGMQDEAVVNTSGSEEDD